MKNKDNFNLKIFIVLELFIKNPYKEFYLREISKKTKLNPNTVQRFTEKFLKEKLIIEERKANLRYFKANLESNFFKQIKISYIVNKIEKTGILEELKEKNFSSATLFGSSAKGEDDENSDIDLICIGDTKKIDLSKYENKIQKEINIHTFILSEWETQKEKNKAFYQDVISTGITLLGYKPI